MTITTCPSCGSQAIRKVQGDWTGAYQGKAYIVPALTFYECPDCGEKIYDQDAMRAIEQYSPAFQTPVSTRTRARKKSRSMRGIPKTVREKV